MEKECVFSVSVKDTETFIKLSRLLINITKDERIPYSVREEILDKANLILEENKNGR